jgi:hypothetical protein
MTDEQPDLSAELSRAEEAAHGGIQMRAVLVEIDDDDDRLETAGEAVDALDGDDDVVEDDDAVEIDA